VPLARPSLQAWTTEVLEAGVRLDTVDRSEAAAKCSRAVRWALALWLLRRC